MGLMTVNRDYKIATIMLCTCDSYEDLWPAFFKLLMKNWSDLPFKVLLNTETKSYNYDGVDIFTLPNREKANFTTYGSRMREHIKSIDTEYTIIMLDDFFIRRKVNTDAVYSIIDIMTKEPDVAVTYLTPSINNCSRPYKDYSSIEVMDKYAMYKLNMQAAIWRTRKLLEYWDDSDNPWTWEMFANYTTFLSSDVFLQIKSFDLSPVYYGYNPDGMGVFRGKWVKDDVVPLFQENGIEVDYSKRGFYERKTEKNYFKNKLLLIRYMMRRIGFSYTCGFFCFYIKKYIFRALRIRMKYPNHPAQLQANFEKKEGKAK